MTFLEQEQFKNSLYNEKVIQSYVGQLKILKRVKEQMSDAGKLEMLNESIKEYEARNKPLERPEEDEET